MNWKRCSSFALIVLFMGLPLAAVQVITETVGKTTEIVLLLPPSDYGLDRPDSVQTAHVSLYIAVIGPHDRIVYESRIEDHIVRPDTRFANGRVFHRLLTNLAPGKYQLFVRKLLLPGNQVEQFKQPLLVPKEGRRAGLLFWAWRVNDTWWVFNQPPRASVGDSCHVWQSFSIPAQQLRLSIGAMKWDLVPTEELSQSFVPVSEKADQPLTIAVFKKAIITTRALPLTVGYLFRRQYSAEDQREMMKNILTSREIDRLNQLSGILLQTAIDSIWVLADPSPGTVSNEAQDAFYRLVHAADSLFGVPGVIPGWKSDRGKVYLRYGPPWDVSGEPFPVDGPPYVVWTYPQLGKKFIFCDWKGYGDYELYETTDD